MSRNYTVADYLLDRLAQIGIRHFFGVPGDYNLQFLDHVIDHPQITWVGCANELNAAYAADGYARCKPAAALLTTFGVGELSAINGIAGSYAEYLPVIHVVGAPALRAQHAGDLLHHSLGDGDFGHFARMAKEVTVAQASLTASNAEAEIDRVLTSALFERRPVYLLLPSDVAEAPLASRPSPLILRQPDLSDDSLQAFIIAAQEKLQAAQRVSLLADFLAERFGAETVLETWMNEVNIPHSTLLLGKGVLDESHPCFTGTYAAAASAPQIKQLIEGADVIINVGVRFTDTITAGFSHNLPRQKCIEIQPFEARVGEQVFSQIPMCDAVKALHQLTLPLTRFWSLPSFKSPSLPDSSGGSLDQHSFWQQIQSFLQPGDILIAEQGTSCFGAAALTLPSGCRFIVQALWGSIGYTLPAAFGAQTAEPLRRIVLLIGDGAAQLTVQELGTMLRDGQKPVIFLLNNDGYTVERAIHGPEQRYNDIAQWDWTRLPQALAIDHHMTCLRVSEPEQLRLALEDIGGREQLIFIEVVLPKMDIPELLDTVSKALQSRNAAA
ncbi:alpha-keto acid decarboxylase family protein [Serratia sp. UGAL515B_01]|uniref:alpha-keto acid decarboxylase family protein n=1 Tax=Serratia sp. UGAL515B_01 TaxID=2986763 RepID=UPI002953FED1|nr:thiamine pyrophosphate-binding protein [Serratia sp. UGAL515B_01]WON75737.1 thiamine pyrophosphate-binding protein [Serratia sp. UGAL515B_01]